MKEREMYAGKSKGKRVGGARIKKPTELWARKFNTLKKGERMTAGWARPLRKMGPE